LVPSPPQPPPGPEPLRATITHRTIHTDSIEFKVDCPKGRPAQIDVMVQQIKLHSGTYPDGDWDIAYGVSDDPYTFTCAGNAQKITVPLVPVYPEYNNRGGLVPGYAAFVGYGLQNTDIVPQDQVFYDSLWQDNGGAPNGYIATPDMKIVQ